MRLTQPAPYLPAPKFPAGGPEAVRVEPPKPAIAADGSRYSSKRASTRLRVLDDTGIVGAFQESNVRILECAWEALEATRHADGLSRDEMVRRLVIQHVREQHVCREEDRLTHISTLLRHPAAPLGRGSARPGKLLRLRLPPGLAEEARSVSLRLPGQPIRRGHRDYQARLLADAVTTAIARLTSFTDDVLADLRPIIRHGAALGLWRLAVAATRTGSESEAYRAAADVGYGLASDASERAARVAEVLRSQDVAWHDRHRYEMVAHLARRLLNADVADANEQMLYEQGDEWLDHRDDLEYALPSHPLIDGFSARRHWSLQGRGGAAVWRAERQVGLREFAEMLTRAPSASGSKHTASVKPPGWPVEGSAKWSSIVSSASSTDLEEPWSSRVAAGSLISISLGDRRIYWPVDRSAAREEQSTDPVRGLQVVIETLRHLPPVEIAERVLLKLDRDHDEEWQLGAIEVPVYKACDFGLIDIQTRNALIAETREVTRQYMEQILELAPTDHLRHQLRGAMDDPPVFGRLARSFGVHFSTPRTTWQWRAESIVAEVQRGQTAEALRWLSAWVARRSAFALERSMAAAWRRGFERFDRR